MDIELLNQKITIQHRSVTADNIGNRSNTWTDYHVCHATVSGENGSAAGSEKSVAGLLVDHSDMDFTIRWCDAVKTLTTDDYRVMFNSEVYNIIGIDHMNYKRKSLKMSCKKERG